MQIEILGSSAMLESMVLDLGGHLYMSGLDLVEEIVAIALVFVKKMKSHGARARASLERNLD